jgi:hypothetical protein
LIVVTVLVAFAATVRAQNTPGPAPVVAATDTGRPADAFHVTTHGPAAAPNHPPMEQVPPRPMPSNPVATGLRSAIVTASSGVAYDVASRRQITAPLATQIAASAAFGSGGGYKGADGGGPGFDPGGELLPASMGLMTLLSPSVRAQFPYRMNVKLLMRWGTDYFVCSGSMRDANVVLTAGHCVYDTTLDAFADEVWVYPAWDGNGSLFGPPSTVNPFGWAHSTALGSNTGWTVNHDLNFDIGAVAIDRAAGFLTGWFGWAYGGDCTFAMTTAYSSASYPAEACSATLHTGADMYLWNGSFDSCPNTNRLGLNTPQHGCLGAVWGGMSGSGAYYTDSGGNRLTHAVTSTSDRYSYAEYTRQWPDWVNYLNGTFDPVNAQGSTFNLQPLHVAGATTVVAGQTISGLTHVAANTSTASLNANFSFNVYLSNNDEVAASDTFLGNQVYSWSFTGVSAATIAMAPITIPANTPPGTYYIGVIYDDATDGNIADNDTDGWDALRITVVAPNAADLSVPALSGPSVTSPGATFAVANTVANTGGSSSGPIRVGLYLSQDNVCTTGDTLIGSRTVTIAAGDSSSASTPVTIPAGTALGPAFLCAIADDLNAVVEPNENDNTRATAISVISAVPIVTLKVNGQHPTPPVVTTTGAYNLTLTMPPTTYASAVDVYWLFIANNSPFWITSHGLSTTPGSLAHMVPGVLTDAPLLSVTLPHGTTLTAGYFLVNGSTLVASDVITAQVP